MTRPIRTALISVSDKTGIETFAKFLQQQNIKILSTGGTANLLRESGIDVTDVSEHTNFPEMLDGRVKTLHPTIHGGILGRRDLSEHKSAMDKHNIEEIDLVVVNLYPFEATVAKDSDYNDCIENIDIGGPAMIRSAAKNHADVTVIVDINDYSTVKDSITNNSGATTLELRKILAKKAYSRTAAYDSAISTWFAKQLDEEMPKQFNLTAQIKQSLRYGENPHQKAAFYSYGEQSGTLAGAKQIQGKELSYNNLNDTDAAWSLVSEFQSQPTVAIIKHANPCGIASGESLLQAYDKALSCDSQSAFGGIIALNGTIDAEVATAISKQFAEVIIAPNASPEALDIFAKKKNLRVLLTGGFADRSNPLPQLKTISGGLLVQDVDNQLWLDDNLKTVTNRKPSEQEIADLRFAFTICKHVKSNAIVVAKNNMTIGIGAGQMSRVDSVRLSGWKADAANMTTKGAVLASDAFFPFDDNVHVAAEMGITALIQPGGSIRDDEVIAAANKHNIAMVLTGMRHFKH